MSDTLKKIYWVDDMGDLSPLACAYARATGADRMSSFGDFISLSDVCDADTARLIKREVSDGVIAPGYTDEALEILKAKKNGNYNIIKIDENYTPAPLEHKQVFGVTFEQGRNELNIDDDFFSKVVTKNTEIPESAKVDMAIAMITLKLWQLAALALPLIILLAGQTLLIFLFTYFVIFNIMGRDYDAAVIAAGVCGFGMGATPNAMANMQALCEKYAPSVKAYLLIPLVGSLFADFLNSLVITFFINFI